MLKISTFLNMLYFRIDKISTIFNQLLKFKPRRSRAKLRHRNNTEKGIFAIVKFRVFEIKKRKLQIIQIK